MAYTLEYNHTLKIIELIYTGQYTSQESRESTSKTIALGKEHSYPNTLVDAKEMEFVASLSDLLRLPDYQYPKEGASRKSRVAVLPPSNPKYDEAAHFYENACLNRGWQVRLFQNRDDAIQWLTRTDLDNKLSEEDS